MTKNMLTLFSLIVYLLSPFQNTYPATTVAEENAEISPTALFRVTFREDPQLAKNIFIMGTQHNLRLENLPASVRRTLATLTTLDRAYPIVERNVQLGEETYEQEIRQAIEAYANLERYEGVMDPEAVKQWQVTAQLLNRDRSLSTFPTPLTNMDHLIKAVFTYPDEPFFLPFVHPIVAQRYLQQWMGLPQSLIDLYCNHEDVFEEWTAKMTERPTHPLLIVKYLEERQITAILDRQIEALFKGKAILT
jgi:hypothetical protein